MPRTKRAQLYLLVFGMFIHEQLPQAIALSGKGIPALSVAYADVPQANSIPAH